MNQASLKKKMPPDKIVKIAKLFFNNPWLGKHEEAFNELVEACDTFDEQLLIFDLLDRFNYVKIDDMKVHLENIVKYIFETLKLPIDKTQIVATTVDTAADSAQMIIQFLKPIFAKLGYRDVKIVNSIRDSVRNVIKYPNVVYVDEFVGTGKTMVRRIRDFSKNYDLEVNKEIANGNTGANYVIYVAVLASMIEAKVEIEKTGVSMFASLWLNKGISYHYEGEDLDSACLRMKRLETLLVNDVNADKFPSFGYGKAEALYCLEEGNIPNSVFPLFWWPSFVDGTQRQPMFFRMEES